MGPGRNVGAFFLKKVVAKVAFLEDNSYIKV
jgi:hypothetical protein